jgi:hypothetical protein
MNSKEKTIVALLGVVILVALIGIGFLLAKLITDAKDKPAEGISVTETAAAAAPLATATLIAAPSLEGMAKAAPVTVGSEPVVVARQESVGPLAPVLIVAHPLEAGHRYRLMVTASNDKKVPISGSWSQSATSVSGKVAAPQIEFFEGTTPHTIDIKAPVPDPNMWGVSISAGPKAATLNSPNLILTILDVTGAQ